MKLAFYLTVVVAVFLLISFVFMKKNNVSPGMVYRSIIMEPAIYRSGGNQLAYRLYKPKVKSENEKKPLVVILHSGAHKGDNNFSQLSGDVSIFVSRDFQKIEATFVLAPQCPDDVVWIDTAPSSVPIKNYDMEAMAQSWRETLLLELIDKLANEHEIDRERIYIVGRSMGADAVWDILYRFPESFAGAIILNGRTDPNQAERISKTPIRHFHGSKDTITPIENALAMRDAISLFDTDYQLTILDDDHGIWENIYSTHLYNWLLRQRKTEQKVKNK